MDFHSYAKRILYMHGHRTINRMPNKKIQKRLQVKNSMLNTKQVRNCRFARLNNEKIYYFSDSIVLLTLGNAN